MKQPKLPFKTRRMILNKIIVIFAVAMIFFYNFFTTTGLGVSFLIIFLAFFCVLLNFGGVVHIVKRFFGSFRGFRNIASVAVMN